MIRTRTFVSTGGNFACTGLISVLLAAGFSVPAAGQVSLPDNPPELKDFRLDTPPPRDKAPEPQPIPQQQTQQQPKTATPPAKAQPAPVPEQRVPQLEAPALKSSQTSALEDQPSSDVPEAAADSYDSVQNSAPQTTAPTAAAESSNVTADQGRAWLHYWPIFAVLLTVLAAFGLFRLLKGRAAKKVQFRETPTISPVRKAPIPPPETSLPTAALKARFESGDAQLSLANLTITGQLHLHYTGTEPLQKLSMRTKIMSACDGQAAVIETFHADTAQGDREILGDMKPGESIVLKLQLQVPRDALQAFDWRERRFVAPIILVNVASEGGTVPPCRLTCVVGRVGDTGSPRLLPIPIDRGPKRFDGVQFQPIAA